ncbi:pantothenate kinase [Synechococcus elongatus]|uniref:Type III pantothenate kinase n=1 Tax=Synechococcus elongatus PCC 11801 TaxID=2219813 RepID=A0AAN1UUW1_SYNEL|nr:pantothenate kinase [Synechococcus elongatus]AZB72980.1 pantothenate kinase [Synechococcus elongatus PCC 11801]
MSRLALAIGNSRWHWGYFSRDSAPRFWDAIAPSQPLSCAELAALLRAQHPEISVETPIAIASVVPQQLTLLPAGWPQRQLQLSDVPLANCYPTLGLDRAIALYEAGYQAGWPVLLIDCGTAITVNAADDLGQFAGGAILPGVALQLRSLTQGTAALPRVAISAEGDRWAMNTSDAIASGVIHGLAGALRGFIEDWRSHHPQRPVYFTGGDGTLLARILTDLPNCRVEPHLLLQGINRLAQAMTTAPD